MPTSPVKGRPKHPLTREVEEIWAANRTGWRSAAEVHRKVQEMYRDLAPSLRKVQEIVREATDTARGSRAEGAERDWVPWLDSSGEKPGDVGYLFRVAHVADSVTGEPLKEDDAKWAVRLRSATNGLHLLARYLLAREYATRERVADVLQEPHIRTSDLDQQLTWRPWDSERHEPASRITKWAVITMLSSYRKPLTDTPDLSTWLSDALKRADPVTDGGMSQARWWPVVSALNEIEKESFDG